MSDIEKKRQERLNKVSKLIGESLLKGHTMLNECCVQCNTVIMRERNGKKYCCACDLLDEKPKSVPVLVDVPLCPPGQTELSFTTVKQNVDISKNKDNGSVAPSTRSWNRSTPTRKSMLEKEELHEVLLETQSALIYTLRQLNGQLSQTSDHKERRELLKGIRSTISTLEAVKSCDQNNE